MILLTLLITVLLEYYFDLGKSLRKWGWLKGYCAWIEKQLQQYFKFSNDYAVLLAILFPVVLFVGLCQSLLNEPLWGLLDLIFGVVILLLCVEAKQLITAYMASSKKGDEDAAAKALGDNPGHLTFAQFLREEKERVITPVFWYVLLGPMGAVLYRMSLECVRAGNDDNRQRLLIQWLGWLEWIPVRLSVLSFAMVGNFLPCFRQFLTSLFTGPESNHDALVDGANRASNIKAQALVNEKPESVGIIAHSMILWLVIVAILTVTAWVN